MELPVNVRQPSGFSSPKRGSSERSGLHDWFPYYAGFSSEFVGSVIDEFSLNSVDLVLDPMNGSGTTTQVCVRRGVAALGIDRNPVMVVFASAKDPRFLTLDLLGSAERHATQVREHLRRDEPRKVETTWFSPHVARLLYMLRDAIEEEVRDGLDGWHLELPVLTEQPEEGRRLQAFHMAALLRTARHFSAARQSKNPSWIMKATPPDASVDEVLSHYVKLTSEMRQDLDAEFAECADGPVRLRMTGGDARSLAGVRSEAVNAIITSPPYLTRIEYAMSTAPELEVLREDGEDGLRALRRTLMGTTCITIKNVPAPRKLWGTKTGEFLRRMKAHPSKASGGYYYKNAWQYFEAAHDLVASSLRVLVPGGRAAFVIQDSWYKDVPLMLAEIYAEMAVMQGAEAEVAASFLVTRHMGQMNPRSRKYPKGDVHEHVVVIRRPE